MVARGAGTVAADFDQELERRPQRDVRSAVEHGDFHGKNEGSPIAFYMFILENRVKMI